MICCSACVRFWHKADMAIALSDVRFGGSGHCSDVLRCPLMTRSGYQQLIAKRLVLTKHFFTNSSSNLLLKKVFMPQAQTAHWSYAATRWLDAVTRRILGLMRSFTPAWLTATERPLGQRRSLWRRMSSLIWRAMCSAHW